MVIDGCWEPSALVPIRQGCRNVRVLTALPAAVACRNGTPQEMAAAFIGGASAVSPFAWQLQRRQQQQLHMQWRSTMQQLPLQAAVRQKQTHVLSRV
jgi:hypothetical protein